MFFKNKKQRACSTIYYNNLYFIMSTLLASAMGGKDYYSVNATFNNGVIKISAEDMEKLLLQFPQDNIPEPKTYMYIGMMSGIPTYKKYVYNQQVKYIDDDNQEIDYYVQVSDNATALAETYKTMYFPIPMLQINETLYILQDNEMFPIRKDGKIDFELIQSNLDFYHLNKDIGLQDYNIGDIYYDTSDKTFKKLVPEINAITYIDYSKPINVRYAEDNPDITYQQVKSVKTEKLVDGTPTGVYEEKFEVEKLLTLNPGDEIPDLTLLTYSCDQQKVDDDGNPVFDAQGEPVLVYAPYFTEVVQYEYGTTETVSISIYNWITIDTEDTINTYINKYTGQVWTKDLEVNNASNG